MPRFFSRLFAGRPRDGQSLAAPTGDGVPTSLAPDSSRPGARDSTAFAAWAAIALLGFLAWSRRFILDDAFISFRYARNLVEGRGIVFNPGERVEGYTNFLWTLLMAAGLRLRVPIVFWSQLCGLVCYCASLAITYWLARRLLRSSFWALVAMAMVGLNYTFSVYGTGGLETSLQTSSTLLAAYVAQVALDRERLRAVDLAGFSVVATVALLTRLDSAVLLIAPAGALAWRWLRSDRGADATPARPRLMLALFLPALLILGSWFAWKLAYYGALFPLTFDAKTGGPVSSTIAQGGRFAREFVRSYWLLPPALLVLVLSPRLIRVRGILPLAITCVLWVAYVIGVGGDFMEFRLMVPLLPFWTICAVTVPARCLRKRPLVWATAGLIVALSVTGSLHHQKTFKYVAGIESIKGLTKHLTVHRWERIGEVLGDAFHGHADEVTLAVCAAGAIPYLSRLRTVDMFGLSDPVIAREGIPFKTQPGHERTASFRHLLRRGVNLVVGHPWVVPASWKPDLAQPLDLRRFRLIDARPADLPLGARVIEIPLDRETKLLALYLIANPYVEKAIQENGWQTSTIPF